MAQQTGDVPVSSRTRARMAQDKPRDTSSQSDTLATMVTLLQQQQQFMERIVTQQLHEQRSSAAAAAAQATQTSIRSASRTGNIAKKVVAPTLSNPISLTIAEFRDWKVRLRDFMDLNDGGKELRHPASLHAFLRSVLDTGWTRLMDRWPFRHIVRRRLWHILGENGPVQQKLMDQRSKSEDYYNRRARRLPQWHQDQRVLVQHPQTKRWTTQATVIRKSATGRSYEVRDKHGKQFWRNRRMLRPYYGQ